jgi:hypothetical protein
MDTPNESAVSFFNVDVITEYEGSAAIDIDSGGRRGW